MQLNVLFITALVAKSTLKIEPSLLSRTWVTLSISSYWDFWFGKPLTLSLHYYNRCLFNATVFHGNIHGTFYLWTQGTAQYLRGQMLSQHPLVMEKYTYRRWRPLCQPTNWGLTQWTAEHQFLLLHTPTTVSLEVNVEDSLNSCTLWTELWRKTFDVIWS